jgi:putative chitinase
MITIDQIKKICPNNKNPQQLADALNIVLPTYDISNKERIACFIAQCGHESAEFTVLRENLNYSAASLCKVWPKRFNSITASAYNRAPEKIANKVYADRLGNGSEASGEGFKYRGRGAIQLTGKANYQAFAKSIGKTLDDTVAYCETLDGAIASACFFWKTNNLNKLVDANDFVGLTKKINGGVIGLDDRKKHYATALSVLGNITLTAATVVEAKIAVITPVKVPDVVAPPVIAKPVVTVEPKEEVDITKLAQKFLEDIGDELDGVADALNSVGNWFK